MAASHERSVGAAMERKALRAWIFRQMLKPGSEIRLATLVKIRTFIAGRQKRYDRRKGGLGRK